MLGAAVLPSASTPSLSPCYSWSLGALPNQHSLGLFGQGHLTMEKALREQLPKRGFKGTTPQRSRAMRAVHGKDNRTTERRLRLALARSRVRGWKVRPRGFKGDPDFFFPRHRVAVFVDGCFWHGCPTCGHIPQTNKDFWTLKINRNRARDITTTSYLQKQKIRVLRFWEHELKSDLGRCIQKIRATLAPPPHHPIKS